MNYSTKKPHFLKNNHTNTYEFRKYGTDAQEPPSANQIEDKASQAGPYTFIDFFPLLFSIYYFISELPIVLCHLGVDSTMRFIFVSLDFLLGLMTICGLLFSFKKGPKIQFSFHIKFLTIILIIFLLAFTFISVSHNIALFSWAGISVSILVFILALTRIFLK
jgi:hypothetical protein